MVHFEHDNEQGNQQQSSHEPEASSQAQSELAACKEKLAKTEEQMRYLAADFDNFRRNVSKERAQWARLAQTKIFEDLVGIADDFSRALSDFQKISDISVTEKARFAGLELVYKNLMKFFEQQGITEIATNVAFNPQLHEAVMQVDAPGKEAGTIIDVVQKGYMHKDVVVRPARVTVAK